MRYNEHLLKQIQTFDPLLHKQLIRPLGVHKAFKKLIKLQSLKCPFLLMAKFSIQITKESRIKKLWQALAS